jgi:phosphatidylglycerophosphate synthase
VSAAPPRRPIALCRATTAEGVGAALLVAGLPVLERSVKQLIRLGYRVVIAGEAGLALPIPAGVPGLEVRSFQHPSELESIRRELGGPLEVAADVVRAESRLDAEPLRVHDEPSRRRAEDAIFAELLRGDLGLVARTLNKPISFRITRYLLCRFPITPNQVTILAGLIGLLGAALIGAGSAWSMPAGFLLAHLQSVLDGCDGELARVRLQQSAIGEWLDTVVDDTLNLLLTVAIGIGLWRARGQLPYLFAGLIAAAMLITYNAVAYRELYRQGEGGEVLKVRWWFNRGASFKRLFSRNRGAGPADRPALLSSVKSLLFDAFFTLGRRDFFLFVWLVLSLLDLGLVILLYAVGIAFVNFAGAVGQLLWRDRR